MPLRSVLEIDVSDTRFQEFYRLFETYRDALDKMPGAWGKVNAAVGHSKSEFADMAAAMMSMLDLLERGRRKTSDLEEAAGGAARFFSTMSHHASNVARHVESAVGSILKIGGEAALGLLGIGGGGLYGIDRLAVGAGNLRRTSLGLGFAPGNAAGMQAFQTNMNRLVDPGQFLGGVNTALHDLTARWTLGAAGLTNAQIAGKDTGQVSLQLLQNIARDLKHTPEEQLAQVMQAKGYDKFLSLSDAVRVRQTPYSELQELIGQTKYDTKGNTIKITDQDLRNWQDFELGLRRAANTLWDTVVNDLSPLAQPLKNVSMGLTEVADAFLKSPALKEWISQAADGLKQFAGYIKKPEFQTDVENFLKGVGQVSSQLLTLGEGFKNFIGFMSQHTDLFGVVAGAAIGGRIAGPIGAVVGGLYGGGYLSGTPTDDNPMIRRFQKHLGPNSLLNIHPQSFTPPSGTDVDTIRKVVEAAGGNETAQAAMLAMMNPESGLDPSKLEIGRGQPGVGGAGGASWAQWTGPRRRQLERFGWTGTNKEGDRAAAAKMLYWELTTNPQFKAMLQKMNGMTPTEAAKLGGFVFEQGGTTDTSVFGNGGETQASLDKFHAGQADKFYEMIKGDSSASHSHLPILSPTYVFGTKNAPAGAGVVGSGFDWSGRESKTDLARIDAQRHVSIKIENQTGGNAGISASQVATP